MKEYEWLTEESELIRGIKKMAREKEKDIAVKVVLRIVTQYETNKLLLKPTVLSYDEFEAITKEIMREEGF